MYMYMYCLLLSQVWTGWHACHLITLAPGVLRNQLTDALDLLDVAFARQ